MLNTSHLESLLNDIAVVTPSHKACLVDQCKNLPGANISFFYIPRNAKRQEQWLQALNLKFVPKLPHQHVVCGDHFATGKRSDDPNHPDFTPSIFGSTAETDRQRRCLKRSLPPAVTPTSTKKNKNSKSPVVLDILALAADVSSSTAGVGASVLSAGVDTPSTTAGVKSSS